MTLKDQMTTDMGILFNENDFAVSAVYTTLAGASKTISLILDYGTDLSPSSLFNATASDATVVLKAEDISNPASNDTLLINGETFLVDRVIRGDAYVWVLALVKELGVKA